MRLLRFLLPLLLLAPLGAGAQTFPKLTGRVVDAANLLSPEQEAQLTQQSADVEKASGRQFVVATIPDLQGYPIEDYGYRLGRAWKIGQSEANNGILLLVAPNERKVRIEVGYGLEPVMTDALSSGIIQDVILPKFKAGDMPGGIVAGANEIATQMKLPLEAAEARAKAKLDAKPVQRRSGGGNAARDVGGIIGGFWVVIVIAIIILTNLGGKRGRSYRGGGGGMGGVGQILLWTALDAAMRSGGRGGGGSSWGGGGGSSWGGGGGGGGGFSGGGGSFGGGGASGGW